MTLLHLGRSVKKAALLPAFIVGSYVLVRRKRGPAKGRSKYVAVATIIKVHNYNYAVQWYTQGPSVLDIPNTVAKRLYHHTDLALIPPEVEISRLTNALLDQVGNVKSPPKAKSILACRLGKPTVPCC
jgi:hypothetical protein